MRYRLVAGSVLGALHEIARLETAESAVVSLQFMSAPVGGMQKGLIQERSNLQTQQGLAIVASPDSTRRVVAFASPLTQLVFGM